MPTPKATVPSGARLLVDGNVLRFDGAPVIERGVALGDPGNYDEVSRRDPATDYRWLAQDWKANVVRLSVSPGYWKRYHDLEFTALRRHVSAAVDAGLFVIIDWHAIGWPDGYYQPVRPGDGDPTDLNDSSMAIARDFWRAAATTFTDPRIAFELWNEPTMGPDGEDGTARWRQLVPFWNDLIGVIRGTGSPALLIATSNDWAGDLRGVKDTLLPDPNLAYAWHVYAETGLNDPARWEARLDGLDRVRPVIVTEWGFDPSSAARHDSDMTEFGIPFRDQFLVDRHLHSTAWSVQPDNPPALVEADGRTRTVWGEFVHPYLIGPR